MDRTDPEVGDHGVHGCTDSEAGDHGVHGSAPLRSSRRGDTADAGRLRLATITPQSQDRVRTRRRGNATIAMRLPGQFGQPAHRWRCTAAAPETPTDPITPGSLSQFHRIRTCTPSDLIGPPAPPWTPCLVVPGPTPVSGPPCPPPTRGLPSPGAHSVPPVRPIGRLGRTPRDPCPLAPVEQSSIARIASPPGRSIILRGSRRSHFTWSLGPVQSVVVHCGIRCTRSPSVVVQLRRSVHSVPSVVVQLRTPCPPWSSSSGIRVLRVIRGRPVPDPCTLCNPWSSSSGSVHAV